MPVRVRLVSASAVFLAVSLLAACGGGGGGGSVSPPAPGGGGNGGGGGATPTPVTSGTPAGNPTPSSGPTVAPPTVAPPTVAPPTVPPATPTAPPTASPAPTTTPRSSQFTVQVGNGSINGQDNQFVSSEPNSHHNSGEGDLESTDQDAQGGPGGGHGAAIDNIACEATMPGNYHVHAFVGIINNGTGAYSLSNEIALPDAIGIVNSYGEFPAGYSGTNGFPNQEIYGDCFYHMHTHDASGEVHMEAPSPDCGVTTNFVPPCDTSQFTLGNLFDIWGVSHSAMNFGHFTGPVTVYTSPLKYNACSVTSPNSSACYTPSNSYAAYSGDYAQIPLYSHTVIWIVIGTPPASANVLPNVEWYSST